MLAPTPKRLFLRYRRRGDAAALGKLFDQVAPELLALATHLTRDVSMAEDVVQDTFLSAVESADRYDPERPFMPWLVGVLVNRARKARERRAVRAAREECEPPAGFGGTGGTRPSGRGSLAPRDPADVVATGEVIGLVGQAIESLREPYREVVREHLTEGQPPREIAVLLGRPAGTIRVQLHRGLEQLRDALRAQPENANGVSAMERLSGMGVGLTAAARLERTEARGLDAVKHAVLSGAAEGAAIGASALSGGAPFPVAGAGMFALALVLIAGVAAVALRTRSESDQDVELTRSAAPTGSRAALATGDDLARVMPKPTTGPDTSRKLASGAAAAPGTEARSRTRNRLKERPSARTRRPPPETPVYPFIVRPRILLDRVPDADPFGNVEVSVWEKGVECIGTGSGPAITLVPVSIGEHASVDDLDPELYVRADHRDGLPLTVKLPYAEWVFDGEAYVASPALTIEPIRATVEVRGRPGSAAIAAGDPSRSQPPFEGEAVLVRIDPLGNLERLDRGTLRRSGSRSAVRLRSTRGPGTSYVLGLPKSADECGDLIEVAPPLDGNLELVAHLRRRELSEMKVRVLDPFGQPFPNATILAEVPDDSIAYFLPGTTTPTSIDGWVFAKSTGSLSEYQGLVERRKSADGLRLVLARQRLEATSSAVGSCKLVGALAPLHRFSITTPLNAAPVPLPTFPYSGSEVSAPVVGIEVTCPAELASGDGRKAWKDATVTVTGGERTASARVNHGGSARLLAPPETPLTVKVSAPGQPDFEASIGPSRAGTRRSVMPRPAHEDLRD